MLGYDVLRACGVKRESDKVNEALDLPNDGVEGVSDSSSEVSSMVSGMA